MKVVTAVERTFPLKPYSSIRLFISLKGEAKDEREAQEVGERLSDLALDTIHKVFFRYREHLSRIDKDADLFSQKEQWELIRIREALTNHRGVEEEAYRVFLKRFHQFADEVKLPEGEVEKVILHRFPHARGSLRNLTAEERIVVLSWMDDNGRGFKERCRMGSNGRSSPTGKGGQICPLET
jgi:hypothetical protein